MSKSISDKEPLLLDNHEEIALVKLISEEIFKESEHGFWCIAHSLHLLWRSNHLQNMDKEKPLTFMSFCISNVNESIHYFAHLFHLSYYTVVHGLLVPYDAVLLVEHLIHSNSLLCLCSPPFHTERYFSISVVRLFENAKTAFVSPGSTGEGKKTAWFFLPACSHPYLFSSVPTQMVSNLKDAYETTSQDEFIQCCKRDSINASSETEAPVMYLS